jgi:hypothetical protein
MVTLSTDLLSVAIVVIACGVDVDERTFPFAAMLLQKVL